MNLACVLISLGILVIQYDSTLSLNVTTGTTGFNIFSTTNATENTAMRNKIKRRVVLIVNSGHTSLRNDVTKERAVNLLYEERDDNGNKLNTFMMSNLDDVARFFEAYLKTDICHRICEGDE